MISKTNVWCAVSNVSQVGCTPILTLKQHIVLNVRNRKQVHHLSTQSRIIFMINHLRQSSVHTFSDHKHMSISHFPVHRFPFSPRFRKEKKNKNENKEKKEKKIKEKLDW